MLDTLQNLTKKPHENEIKYGVILSQNIKSCGSNFLYNTLQKFFSHQECEYYQKVQYQHHWMHEMSQHRILH